MNWRLFTDGNEQAMIVDAAGQFVDFYGKGLDLRETDTRTYFLIADTVAGKRMTSKFLGNIGGNVVSNNFRASVELRERRYFNAQIKNGEAENYFGRGIVPSVEPCTNPSDPCLSLNLDEIDPAGPSAVARVRIQGLYPVNGPHSTRLVLNGHGIGQVDGNDTDSYSGDLVFPASFLSEGANVPQFATVQPTNADYFDSIKITYSRRYQAGQNKLLFSTPGYRKVNVNGFASANIRVFDVTLDGNPQMVTDLPITQNGSTFSVRLPSNRPAVMYAVENSGLLHSPSITPDHPSTLATPNNQADMIIISHADLMAGAEAWANYRRSQAGGGFTVKVIDVADIYDEFSYGNHSGAAVRNFLGYAKNNWQAPGPRCILIISDASTDPRNYEGYGNNDFVPTRFATLTYEEAASDEALADFNDDGVSDIAIGRIPARTLNEITTVLNKTMVFEVPELQSLSRGFLCASDLSSGLDYQMECQALKDQLPPDTPTLLVNRGDPMAHENLINGLNTGKFLVNFAGHTATGVWGNANFFSTFDVPSLTNVDRPSVFTVLTGYNGIFTIPSRDSLTEALLKSPTGGAVAAWTSTSDTTPDYPLALGTRFYNQIGAGNITRMGDLVADAKTTIAPSDTGYSWVLLGDPALKVRP